MNQSSPIDLSKVTEEELSQIRNEVVIRLATIARGAGGKASAMYDSHSSSHSKNGSLLKAKE